MRRAGPRPPLWLLGCMLAAPLIGVGTAATLEGCSPGANRDAVQVTDSVMRAGCIVVRAVSDDEKLREVCVTAEDLAPLFSELLSEHEKNRATETTGATLQIAAALPAPRARVPARRCAQWVPVLRSGGDAGDRDSAAPRDSGGERGDGGR